MNLTRRDFKKVFRGYETGSVDTFIGDTLGAIEEGQTREKILEKKVAMLTEELTQWKHRETELAQIREKALSDAEKTRNDAATEAAKKLQETEERAQKVRGSTEEWLETLLDRLDQMQRQKQNFLTALRSSLDSHYELLKEESDETTPLSSLLTEFLGKRLSSPLERRLNS